MDRKDSYDFIVVGAGSAGCALAARLSESESATVLCVEAGSRQMPGTVAADIDNPAHWKLAQKTVADWQYKSVPQEHLREGGSNSHRSTEEPRGKLPGGTSNLYIMMHIRGHPSDFDGWAYGGCPGWSYQDVLPYFQKLEDYEDDTNPTGGKGGPLAVASACLHQPNPLSQLFIHACSALGFSKTDDFNGPNMEGVGWHHANIKEGKRHNMFAAYLAKALNRPNLTLECNAQATRLLFEGDRCVGIEYASPLSPSSTNRVNATREVIVCAGAIETPKLLLLSGIGEPTQLQGYGIPVVAALPGVGENFHNHVLAPLVYKTSRTVPRPHFNLSEVALFYKSEPSCIGPDMQMAFVHADPQDPDENANVVVFLPGVVRPTSRGWVRLESRDPFAHPKVNPHYLATQYDLDRLIQGMELADRIATNNVFSGWIGPRVVPPPEIRTDQFGEWVRALADSYHHQAGSCKMGTDAMAVVDTQLRVRGVRGLRAVDASIMPTVPSGNCHAAIVMIAEKAADMIKATHGLKTTHPLPAGKPPTVRRESVAMTSTPASVTSAASPQVAVPSPSPVFNHIALTCKDPIAVERFYTKYFGFRRARVIPIGGGKQIVFIRNGGMYLELFEADEALPLPAGKADGPHNPGVRHIAFKVDNLEGTLAAMGEEVAKRITLGPLDFKDFIPGWRTAWLADPEGNIVEISQGYVDQDNPPPLGQS